jgi:hypothetical protein
MTICLDDMLHGPTWEIEFNDNVCLGKFEKTTQSKLYHFKGVSTNIVFDNITVPRSFYTKYYKNGSSIPKDSCLLFYAYATHLNAAEVPCNVCVGCGSLNLYDVYVSIKKRGKCSKTITLKNRELVVGKITLHFYEDSIIMDKGLRWHNCPVYSSKTVNEVAHEYAKHEYDWIQLFKKKWKGISGMMDLFGYMMMGHTVPIAYFLQRNREISEKEFKILLYFALRRYAIENGYDLANMVDVFHKLPFVEKCSILTTLLTLVSTSHTYNTDYYITKDGKYELIETFQSPSKSDSGDCEDFSSEIIKLIDTLIDLKNIKDPILKEFVCILKMYTAGVTLCRTTTMNVNMSATEAENKSKRMTQIKFRTISEKRMFDCQGDNENVSAHMNCVLTPTNNFLKSLKPKLNKDFVIDKEYERIIKLEETEFIKAFKHYKRTYDKSFTTSKLIRIILEGTGEFNGVNQTDKYPYLRDKMMDAIPELSLAKFKIFHPTDDPRQFYLNKISMLVPKFIKRHNYPLSTFVFSYNSKKSKKKQIYAVTYNDFIENKPYNLVPRKQLTKKELSLVMATCKKTIRHSIINVNKTKRMSSLNEIASNVDDLKKAFSVYDTSLIKCEMDRKRTKIETYLKGFNKYLEVQNSINNKLTKDRIGSGISADSIVKLCYTFKPWVFLFNDFNSGLKRGLSNNGLGITKVEYFPEIMGENLENIVVVISVKK